MVGLWFYNQSGFHKEKNIPLLRLSLDGSFGTVSVARNSEVLDSNLSLYFLTVALRNPTFLFVGTGHCDQDIKVIFWENLN